jgi:hypothetical protein
MPQNLNDLWINVFRPTPQPGNAAAEAYAVVNPDGTFISGGGGGGGTVTQGPQGTIGGSWYVELTNGTNVIGTIANPIVSSISGSVTVIQPTGSNLNVEVSNFPSTQPVSGTVTSNQGTPNSLANGWPVEITDGTNVLGTVAHPVNVAGTVVATPTTPPTTATDYSIASSATSVTLLPVNTNRKQATFFNDSTAILYIDLSGGTASTSHYTVQLYPNGYYDLPLCAEGTVYTGQITGIWATVNGNARITEVTP